MLHHEVTNYLNIHEVVLFFELTTLTLPLPLTAELTQVVDFVFFGPLEPDPPGYEGDAFFPIEDVGVFSLEDYLPPFLLLTGVDS